MLIQKNEWNKFINHNNFDVTVIYRHPITGEFPKVGEPILNIPHGLQGKAFISETKAEEYIDLPDEWFQAVNKNHRAVKPKEKIHFYMLSALGWETHKEQIEQGYCYPKAPFKRFEECMLSYIKLHQRKLEKMNKSSA